MKIISNFDATGRTSVEFQTAEGDKVRTALTVDLPLAPTPEATLIAAALAAPEMMTGEVALPSGVSAATALAVQACFTDAGVIVTSLAPERMRLASVGTTAILDHRGEGWSTPRAFEDRRSIVLRPLALNEHLGRVFSLGRLVFAASLAEGAIAPTSTADLGTSLAACFLAAERLGCDSLIAPRAGLSANPTFEERAQTLGASIGIRVQFPDEFDNSAYGCVTDGRV